MDVERSLLSKIVETEDLVPVSEARITRDWFLDPVNQRVWDTIQRLQTTYGTAPSAAMIRQEHPDYKLIKVSEPITYLIDQMRLTRQRYIMEVGLGSVVHDLDKDDVPAAHLRIAETLTKLAAETPQERHSDITQTAEAFMARYAELEKLEGRLRGIPTGFHSLDQATLGWQGGNLIFFVGVMKSGKSTALLNSAMAAHRSGKTPAFVSFEMSNDDQEDRHTAFFAGVSYERLRAGQLTKDERKAMERSKKQLALMPPFHMLDSGLGGATVPALTAKLSQLQPDSVYLDGLYMLQDVHGEPPMSPQALNNISRDIKQAALSLNIPIICTTQALEHKLSRGRVTSGSVGYSSGMGQYCDAMISVEQTELDNIQRMALILGRNCRPFEMFVEWNWERGRFWELDEDPFQSHGTASGF